MGLPTPTMKIVFKGSEAVSQAASGADALPLRYAPSNYISNCRNTKHAFSTTYSPLHAPQHCSSSQIHYQATTVKTVGLLL
ncbi:unnamed protein product [Peronospora effusa]|nr:unnamed protein product [Peronospora effusa]